jgi:hypothetical protein
MLDFAVYPISSFDTVNVIHQVNNIVSIIRQVDFPEQVNVIQNKSMSDLLLFRGYHHAV